MTGITLYDPANWTDETLDIFASCFDIVERGCDSSMALEQELRRKFWWLTPNHSYTAVRVWFRNKEMIRGLLNNWRVEDPENTTHASTLSYSSTNSTEITSNDSSGSPCATPP